VQITRSSAAIAPATRRTPKRRASAGTASSSRSAEQYLRPPFYGSRQMTLWLREKQDRSINRKRVQRLMRLMGLEGIAPGPSTSRPHPEHKVYPYLLRGVEVTRANHVWASDISVPQKAA